MWKVKIHGGSGHGCDELHRTKSFSSGKRNCLRTIVVGTFSQITFRRKEFSATGDYEPPIDVSL